MYVRVSALKRVREREIDREKGASVDVCLRNVCACVHT